MVAIKTSLIQQQITAYRGFYQHEEIEYSMSNLFHAYVNSEYLFIRKIHEQPWGQFQQSKLIESVILDFPILPISVVPVEGRLEIISGSQSVIALIDFMNDRLKLWGLKHLTCLTGATFNDLPLDLRIEFNGKIIKLIKFTSPNFSLK